MQPSCSNRLAAFSQISATAGSTGVTPRSLENATFLGLVRDLTESILLLVVLANVIGARGWWPTIASKSKATSDTFLAIGPATLKGCPGIPNKSAGNAPSPVAPYATRPGLGRSPTTEQKLAGFLKEPPRSEPLAIQACPVAKATADPPDEPAQLLVVSQGFNVAPNTSLNVLAPAPNSGVYDLA